jgi:hypothetical protein
LGIVGEVGAALWAKVRIVDTSQVLLLDRRTDHPAVEDIPVVITER